MSNQAPVIFERIPDRIELKRCGFQVVRHPRQELFPALKARFAELLRQRLSEFKGKEVATFQLEEYHLALQGNEIDHHAFLQKFRRELPDEFKRDPHVLGLIEAAGKLTGLRLRLFEDRLEFRVCRPNQDDNNPWHRDHWFPYFTPLMNVYLPMAGSHVDSALQVVPFSHEWSDEDVVPTFFYGGGNKTNKGGVLYSVPEIKECRREIRGHRPDVLPGDFMLFSPKCVHGAGNNFSRETRFSFEFRLQIAE